MRVPGWSGRATIGGLAVAALVGGCRPSAPTSEPAAIVLPVPAAETPVARASAPRLVDPCRDRPRCTVTARHDAGTSAAGRPMVVLELSLGMRSEGDGDGEPVGRDCEEREVWLVHERVDSASPTEAPLPRLLLAMCNDGYGASGVGEDEITVRTNELVHVRMGGSAWRWSVGTTAQLDPPAVVGESHSGWWALSQNHDSESRFDYRTFQGLASQEWPACDAAGELPDLGDTEIDAYRSQPIVATALPAMLATGPIAEAAAVDVDACATRGASPEPRDAAYALVLDPATGTLLAQLRDDDFTAADRLMVWATSQDPSWGLHCWMSQRIAPLEVTAEGRIVAGNSLHPGVVVEVGYAADTARRLLRVRLGALPKSISVGYRDVDKGKGRSGIATSDAEAAKGELVQLGGVHRVDPGRATCVLEGGKLVPRSAEPPPPSEPLLGDP